MEDRFGPWRTIGPKWVLQLDILQQLLISIRVLHTFLLVILVFPQNFNISVVSLSSGQFMGIMTVFCLAFLFCLGMGRMLCPCLTVVLFQVLLHLCFLWLLKHIAVVSEREKVYSLEFTTTSVRRKLSISFWEGKDLVTMTVAQCGRDVPSVKSSVLLCSQVLSAISLEPTIICGADFNNSLDKAPNQKAGLQYPFNLLPLQIEKLLHKPSFSLMGKIDMFSMVRTLLVRLSGLLDEKWAQSTLYFRKVR